MSAAGERVLVLSGPVHLGLTLGPLRRGGGDLTMRIVGQEVWRATRNPEGPATVQLRPGDHPAEVRARAWGAGSAWALEHLEGLVGADDDDGPLTSMLLRTPPGAGQSLLRRLQRRLLGLRIPRTGAVTEALVPVIIEQKVAGIEARRSYRELVAALGEPAPGPLAGLMVPPEPSRLAATPAWAFHRFGIEAKRADTIRWACSYAHRLEQLTAQPGPAALARLEALPGVGRWSSAEVALVALGDPDAVSTGDYHLPHQVAWALTGVPRGSDATMLDLLEPYRGQRGRVLRLIVAGGITAPRFGPRQPIRSFRRF